MDRVVRVYQIAEIGHHLIRVEPALEDLRTGAQRKRVEPCKRGLGIGPCLDGQQRLVDAEIEFRLACVAGMAAEHPLADRQLIPHGRRTDGAVIDWYVAL
ncbi:hypothetical protein D3C72_1599400 [compost metagenome]